MITRTQSSDKRRPLQRAIPARGCSHTFAGCKKRPNDQTTVGSVLGGFRSEGPQCSCAVGVRLRRTLPSRPSLGTASSQEAGSQERSVRGRYTRFQHVQGIRRRLRSRREVNTNTVRGGTGRRELAMRGPPTHVGRRSSPRITAHTRWPLPALARRAGTGCVLAARRSHPWVRPTERTWPSGPPTRISRSAVRWARPSGPVTGSSTTLPSRRAGCSARALSECPRWSSRA